MRPSVFCKAPSTCCAAGLGRLPNPLAAPRTALDWQTTCSISSCFSKCRTPEQAVELAHARVVEAQFGEMAARMGCVDRDGQLMREQLERLTSDLLEARSNERQAEEWLTGTLAHSLTLYSATVNCRYLNDTMTTTPIPTSPCCICS